MFGDRRDHVQGDGLDRGSAIAAMAGIATDVWPGSEAVEVDSHEAVEGVDQ